MSKLMPALAERIKGLASPGDLKKLGPVGAFAVLISIYSIYYNSGLHARTSFNILGMQHRGLTLALIIVLAFLIYGIKGNREAKPRLPWYDIVLVVMGVVPSLVLALFWNQIVLLRPILGMPTVVYQVLAVMLMISLLEIGRRTLSWGMPVTALVFILHPFIGEHLPGMLNTVSFSAQRILFYFYAGEDGIWGSALKVGTTIVFTFVMFSFLMSNSGATKFFINLALSFVGGIRGGPAKVAVIASSFFASLSGSGASNVVATGTVTIPLMKGLGYRPIFAGAVEAVASNGGAIMPPVMGTVAFVMADFLGLSYGKIVLYALIPALLYYWAVYVQVDMEAAKLNMTGLPRNKLPSRIKSLKDGWFYLIPVAYLLVWLAVFNAPEISTGLTASLLVILVSQFDSDPNGRLNLARIAKALQDTAKAMCMILVAMALAGIMLGSMGITAIGIRTAGALVSVSGGSLIVLSLVTLIASFVLGLNLSAIPVYVTLAVLVAPAMNAMGVPPIASHLAILYWGILGAITPPVCLVSFVAANLAQASPMATGWKATQLAIGAYLVPLVFIFDPSLILIGTVPLWVTGVKFAFAVFGMAAIGIAFVGHFMSDMGRTKRALFVLGGGLLLFPSWTMNVVGASALVILCLWQWRVRLVMKSAGASS